MIRSRIHCLVSTSVALFWFIIFLGYLRSRSSPPNTPVNVTFPYNVVVHQYPIFPPPAPTVDSLPTQMGLEETARSVRRPADPCWGRYIYVHRLPTRFNTDMLKECNRSLKWSDMCLFTSNLGLGLPLGSKEIRVFGKKGWFATSQFALDVIFYNRMKQYKCLTDNSAAASAIYVPFFAGLDLVRYLWRYNVSMRDAASVELAEWVAGRPEWKAMGGHDHFMVGGRINFDFRRQTNKESDWGNRLLLLPEAKNMTMLNVESSPWHGNDVAVPYPTYFHPSNDAQVHAWQSRVRKSRRPWLFTFTGARRPNSSSSIRDQLMDQCRASKRALLLECDLGRKSKCFQPDVVMKTFRSSVFCLQPQGDSYTRRSAFDSILAGCIPVFFHPGSAYVQYTWYFPKDYKSYSVFIPENDVRGGKVSVEKVLLEIPPARVRAMREVVIGLIPKVIYADPRSRLEKIEDAFDIAVKRVIERVGRVTKEMKQGTFAEGVEQGNSWKYALVGHGGPHEWDHFFNH